MKQLPAASVPVRPPPSGSRPGESASPPVAVHFQNLAQVASMLTVGVGLVVLLGWWRGIDRFIALLRGWPVMLPNTALMFVAAGSAAALLGPESGPRWRLCLGRLLCVLVIWLSALTLAEYLFGWDLGVDRLLFHNLPPSWSPFPGRPSPQTNLSFFLTGSGLLIINHTSRHGHRPTEYLCLSSAAIALLALLGYIHNATPFYGMTALLSRTGMAAHTAVTLVLLNVAVLFMRPRAGGIAILTSEELGGFMARRLLIVALGVFLAGVLLVVGQRAGLYTQPIASALLTFITMAALIAWGLHTASSLNRVSSERRDAHLRETLQRRFLETVIDQMPEGIVLSDASGQVELQNRAWLRLAGADTRLDAVGEPLPLDIRQISGEALPAAELPLSRALHHGEQGPGEEYMLGLPAGRLLPVLISAAPIEGAEGNRLGAVMVVQDISPLKDLEQLRKEWSAMVAHDLRQPASTIELCVELLRQLHAGVWSDTEQLTLDRIQRANQHLKRMISDLLDVSRLEANRLSLSCKAVDLVALAREHVGQQALGELRDRPLCFIAHGTPGPVWADPDRIEQVLSNLLTNAAKYGDPGTQITVELEQKDQWVEVTVTNCGRGIEPEELPRLFQRFSRGPDAHKLGLQGIGLGLYISKGLIEAHGGRIWAKSAPSAQTSFHFTLPLKSA